MTGEARFPENYVSEEVTIQSLEKNLDYDVTGGDSNMSVQQQLLAALDLPLNFSDIFVREGQPLKVGLPRRYKIISSSEVTKLQLSKFFETLDAEWEQRIHKGGFDRAISLDKKCRIRANCGTTVNRKFYNAVIRRFPPEPHPLEKLDLPKSVQAFADMKRGLVLVIGDTCHGKSTTIASLVNDRQRRNPGHVVTFEDPVEVLIPEHNGIVDQYEIGVNADITSFRAAAEDALRKRPTCIYMGELRDEECIQETITLAESGPAVFASLHADSCETGLSKLWRKAGATPAQAAAIAGVVKGIVCQRLIPSIDNSRYHLATEVITPNDEILECIRNTRFDAILPIVDKLSRQFSGELSGADKHGCHTMNYSINRLLKAGKISLEEAREASNFPDDLAT